MIKKSIKLPQKIPIKNMIKDVPLHVDTEFDFVLYLGEVVTYNGTPVVYKVI